MRRPVGRRGAEDLDGLLLQAGVGAWRLRRAQQAVLDEVLEVPLVEPLRHLGEQLLNHLGVDRKAPRRVQVERQARPGVQELRAEQGRIGVLRDVDGPPVDRVVPGVGECLRRVFAGWDAVQDLVVGAPAVVAILLLAAVDAAK